MDKEQIKHAQVKILKYMQEKLHEKPTVIYCDGNERLWYDIVELDDVDRVIKAILEEIEK